MFLARSIFTALVLCALTGCATMPDSKQAADGQAVQAGKTTFVRVPSGHGQYSVIAYRPPGQTVCSNCAAIAADYFQTGKLETDTCNVCGAKITVGRGQVVTVR